ncbi:MAG: ABC transporter permease [Bifidobacteriaceae bacterium]|jgi:peptide/nickel transport system permease protein|nr:ABC transporter permease [Bifidobacteriaceae bacterium]
MIRFATKRLLQAIPVLLGLVVLVFIWVRLLPGDPAQAMLGENADPAAVARLRVAYGFDKPILEQFWVYLQRLAHGDFGNSITTGQPVFEGFISRFPATIELAVAAMAFAVLLGIPIGYFAARHRGSLADGMAVGGSLFGFVVPVFFLAFVLKYLFAIKLPWFPTIGRQDPRINATHYSGFYILDGILTGEWDAALDAVRHLVLPAIALGAIPLAMIVRITRASVLDVISEDYVRTARAKGLTPRLISRRHVLRNALLPVATIIGLQTGALLAGAVLTEQVFAINGVGSYMFNAITSKDYPVLQACILFVAVIYTVINLLTDMSYGLIDPRARLS